MMAKRLGSWWVALCGLAGTSGCLGVRYVSQAAYGQLSLLQKARPLGDVLADAHTPARLKHFLAEVERVKAFARRNALVASQSYQSYAELDGPAVVWVVNAAEPLSFVTKKWSFPLVGSFPYLGWFELEEAQAYQRALERDGWEVDVRGARAYSTLGWFRDPVLSSMLTDGDEAMGEFVNVIVHESVHTTLHIPGQAFFNESLASFVAEALTPVYLAERFGADSRELAAYLAATARDDRKKQRLLEVYEELDNLYQSTSPARQKLARKREVLSAARRELDLEVPPNNAYLATFRTYGVGRAELGRLLAACGDDWARFFRAVSTLGAPAFAGEQQEDIGPILGKLAQRGCP